MYDISIDLLLFAGNIKESYLVNPSPPSTLQKTQRRKWFQQKYSRNHFNNKNKNEDGGIPYPFRVPPAVKPKKIQQPTVNHGTGTGTKIKSSFGSNHGKKPVVKSLFSFGSMKPGAKINPFTYGSKLIGYR